MEFVETIGFKVFSDDISKIPLRDQSCKVINTISPNSYGITVKDQSFKEALKKTDYLVLDGVYFAFASLLLKRKNIRSNQGPFVFYHFMKRVDEVKGRAFFLGSTQETLQNIEFRAAQDYSGVQVASYSPPFKMEFSDQDDKTMIDLVNAFNPDVLFVGMTCPKQEKWAIKNRQYLNAGLIICIGNVFDWFAGTQKEIHPFWFKVKLVWLVRIFLRPEIFRRNIGNQMTFFWHIVLIFLKLKKYD